MPSGSTLTAACSAATGRSSARVEPRRNACPRQALLTITGDYTQGPGGTLRADIGPQHDRLDVERHRDARRDAPARRPRRASTRGPRTRSGSSTPATRTGTFATVSGTQATPEKAYLVDLRRRPASRSRDRASGRRNTARAVDPGERASPATRVTCDPGSWTGTPTLRLHAGCATARRSRPGRTYTLVAADGGRSIVCRVTATNANGSTQADSNTLTPPADSDHAHADPDADSHTEPASRQRAAATAEPPARRSTSTAERGTVTVRLPDGRTVPLDDATQIVTGSVIDTRKGAVRLDSRGAGGKLESGVFSDGLFKVTQTHGRQAGDRARRSSSRSTARRPSAATAPRERRRRSAGCGATRRATSAPAAATGARSTPGRSGWSRTAATARCSGRARDDPRPQERRAARRCASGPASSTVIRPR